jgi:hypothetical protein
MAAQQIASATLEKLMTSQLWVKDVLASFSWWNGEGEEGLSI